jgi:ribosomal protein S18 acetylase RimI-like enzyme
MENLRRLLSIAPAGRTEHLSFNLLEFRFFKNSEEGVALPFGDHWFLSILTVVPYILSMELIFFRAKRYFVTLGENVIGVVVFREKPGSLLVASLGVAKEYRRLGVATYVLRRAEKLAIQLGKQWLELTVLKGNTPAQRLYVKSGFSAVKEKRMSFIMKKQAKIRAIRKS